MRRNHWFAGLIVLAMLGAATSRVEARGSVTVTFTTTPPPANNYNPNNIVAVWIEGAGGTFIKTIDRWSLVRTQYLLSWIAKAGAGDMDAVSGATRAAHGQLTVQWNLKDKQGNIVPDGTYTIRMELASSNATSPANNNQGTFTFVKGPNPQLQQGLANGGFTNVTINYDANAPACGDGIVDAPEKCDPMLAGSCPATCVAADACMPQTKVGAANMCTAECVAGAPITACTDADGCCPAGCEGTDTDCDAGGGGGGGGANGNEITGGCAVDGNPSAILFGLPLLAFALRRRRAR